MKTLTLRTIVFDIGGVLVHNPAQGLLEESAAAWDISVQSFKPPYLTHFSEYERGIISVEKFYELILIDLGHESKYNYEKATHVWFNACHKIFIKKWDTLKLVAKLKSHNYNLALLSNTEPQTTHLFKSWGFEQLFKTQIYSCFEACAKPSPEIYHLLEKRTNSRANEILFIDDKLENIQAARLRNWHCIHYQNEVQFHQEIKNYLGRLL